MRLVNESKAPPDGHNLHVLNNGCAVDCCVCVCVCVCVAKHGGQKLTPAYLLLLSSPPYLLETGSLHFARLASQVTTRITPTPNLTPLALGLGCLPTGYANSGLCTCTASPLPTETPQYLHSPTFGSLKEYFLNKVSLYSPAWPRTHRDPSALSSRGWCTG